MVIVSEFEVELLSNTTNIRVCETNLRLRREILENSKKQLTIAARMHILLLNS